MIFGNTNYHTNALPFQLCISNFIADRLNKPCSRITADAGMSGLAPIALLLVLD